MRVAVFALGLFVWVSMAGMVMVRSSETGIEFSFDSAVPEFSTTSLQGAEFTVVSMAGAENLQEAGLPSLPVYRVWVEIPQGAELVTSLSDEHTEVIHRTGAPVVPAVQSAPKSGPRDAVTVTYDSDVYSGGATYPQDWVRIVYAGGMRGRNLALVEVMPLRWNPAQGDFTLLESAEISIDFKGGDLAASYEQASRLGGTGFEDLLQSKVINYGIFEGGVDTGPAPYLIVGHSDFVDTAMDDFVAHKQALGYTVTMVDLSVTGSTADSIQAYIQNAINSGTEYVLLVGDVQFLPGGTATTYGDVTDLYYACLDDGGWIPDAFLGRFSVTTAAEAITMAQRVIDYENTTGVLDWVQNALFIASDDNYSISEGTHNFCVSNYLDPRGYNSIKVYAHSGGTASDAVAAINDGLSMVTFSGHGSETYWADMSFNSSDFAQLTNDGMFPGVLSHACLTGAYSTATCWAETWTRTPDKGGLWFWGSVPSTYWDEDDYQQKGEYDAFLGNDVYWPKGFLNLGLMAVYEAYSGGGRTQYYYEGYTLFGDPSLTMKTWPMTGIGEGHSEATGSPVSVAVANPARGSVPVVLSGIGGPASVEIFDLSGRVVDTPYRDDLNGTATFTWNTESVSTGVYFVRLTQGGNTAIARVSVVR